MDLTPAGIFRRYEEVRPRLPAMPRGGPARAAADLFEIAGEFDVFFFDAFGVLNIGDTVISGAPETIAALKADGKSTYVVTNGATRDASAIFRKLSAMGFPFTRDEIITSRTVLTSALGRFPDVADWGAMLPADGSRDGLPESARTVASSGFWEADGYLFLSSRGWNRSLQRRLVARLQRHPCPVLVGNPDLAAPREQGFSMEAGFFGHDIMDRADCPVWFFGKPFGEVFDAAGKAATAARGAVDPARTVMVGDTLHTDVIGGAAAGIRTVLVAGHGAMNGQRARAFIEASGIRPDFVMPTMCRKWTA